MKAHTQLMTTSARWLALAAVVIVLIGLAASSQATSAATGSGPGICSNNKAIACSTNADCGAGNTCYLPTAGGQTLNNQVCMQTAAGQGLNCTANDVNLAATTSLSVVDKDPNTPGVQGCLYPGDTATISFVAQFDLTAQDRYDIGVWIAQDGGNALTGTCSVSDFPISPTPPWTNLDASGQPTDTCGDITSSNNPLYSSIQSIQVQCIDANGDGNLDINTCLSWQQSGGNGICTSPVQAFPGSPSKCKCQALPGIAIGIPGVIKVDKVTYQADGTTLKPGDTTSFPFTLTGGPNNISQSFNLTDAATPYSSGSIGVGSTPYKVTETVPTGWSLMGATCTSSQGNTQTASNIVLHNGETVTCTFNDKVTPTPALNLTKAATPVTYNSANQTISYSYVLKNTGNVVLSSPFAVTDNKATVTCPATPTSLNPGDTITCTASYTTTQADIDSGSVTNTATATAKYGTTTVTSNQATATVTAVKTPALSLTKSADPLTYDHVGQTITYSYVIKNTGNVTLTGTFSVTDDKATVTCTQPADGALSPNETMSCTATYTITQADLDGTSVINKATASGGGATSNEVSATVTPVKNPALTIKKSATESTYAAVGDLIHYSYLVTNSGNVTLTQAVTVNDSKTTATCPALDVAGLKPGASITCSATYTITQADLDAGSVTNSAYAMSGTTQSNTDSVTVPATQTKALSLTKTASPLTYTTAGQTISYSYDLKNTGNVTLVAPFAVTDDKAAVTCPSGVTSLAPGATVTCSASHTVTQAEVDLGSIINIATATAKFGSDTVTSNQAQATVTAIQSPSLSLVKSASPSTYDAVGQVISYSYLLKNTGNVTLVAPFTVSDDKATVTCPATPTSLAPGDTTTCTASYTIAQADLDAGKVTNVATGRAVFKDNGVYSNPDTKTVNALQQGGLALTKSADPTTYDHVGAVITYNYVVKNTGNVTLAGPFTVNDDKSGAVSCPSGSLAPQATVTCTGTYAITQADLDAGSVTNTATATDGTLTSNQAQATVNAVKKPALTLKKTAQETTYAAVGDVLHYSYLVTNSGNVTLHDVIVVSDDQATDESCPALPAGGLAPGASITCTASHTVTQADLDAGKVTNVASATSGTTTSNTDTVTVPATQTKALSLKKTASPATYATVGQTINYSYVLTNTGNVTLVAPFAVADDKAAVTCPAAVTSLAPNATVTCTTTYTITQVDLDSGSVTNTATATAKFGNDTVTSNQDTATVTAAQAPALSLVKTAAPSTYSAVGDTISYSYVLTNTGNVTLAGPFTVTDDKATVTCPADATLAVGASITCNATYTIAQGDLDAGIVTNIAAGHASFGGKAVDSNQDTQTVHAVQTPALSLAKGADPVLYDHVGQSIAYTYILKNIGNVTLAGPFTVSDNKATVTCPSEASLAVSASITCNATYVVTQLDLDTGYVTNLATGHASFNGNAVDSNQAQATINASQSPALSIDKTAQETTYAKAGDLIHYSYLVTNTGNVTLTDPVTVTDNKTTASCPALDVAGLKPGVSITCTATYTITQADLDAGSLTNVAYATSGTTQSPTDTVTVPAAPAAHLTLVKTATPNFSDPVKVGDKISYDLVATNDGNLTLNNVSISDAKLGTLTCTPAQPAILAPGASLTCTGGYTLTQADIDAGKVDNTAFATSKLPNDQPGPGGQDSKDVPVPQSPHLTATKSGVLDMTVVAPNDRADPGDKINYTITVTNDGNQTLTGVGVTDATVGALTCTPAQPATLAPTEKMVCTGSYILTQADINAGTVHNVAVSTSNQYTPPQTPNDVPVPTAPAMTLGKVPDPTTYTVAGQTVTYTYTVTNTGNVTLTSFTLADDKFSTAGCTIPASLDPSGFFTCQITYTLTQADVDAGSVTNHATATAAYKDQVLTATADATIHAILSPHLTATKAGVLDMTVVAPSDRADPGDKINYTITVLNDGNQSLTGVGVTDAKLGALTCTPSQPATLAPTEKMVCTGSYTLTLTDINAGTVHNVAVSSSNQTPPTDTPNDVPVPKAPALTLTKAGTLDMTVVAPVDRADVGDVINYTLTAANTGNETLTNVSISDPLLGTLTCSPTQPATLTPGASLVCTGSYTLKLTDINAGKVDNTATADSDQTPPTNTPNEVPVPKAPHMTATKAGVLDMTVVAPSDRADVGDKINYTITVLNDGNQTLTGVGVTDATVGALTCTPAQPATLDPGASMVCTGSYTLTQADINAGNVHNVAISTSNEFTPPETPNDVPVPKAPALNFTKVGTLDMTVVAPADRADVGDKINYTLTATNTGNETLTNVQFSDPLLPSLTCTPLQPATLIPGASLTCTGSYTLTQTDINTGTVHNVAVGKSDQTPPTDTPTDVPVPQAPSIALAKSVQETSFTNAGDVLHYTLVATNDGNVTLSSVSISDPLLGTLTCTPDQPATLAPAATLICTGSYTVQQSDVDAGHVANTATATGTFGGHDYTATDSKDVPASTVPHITLTKAFETHFSTPVKVGDTIDYTLTATNDDSVTLNNVTISDALLPNLTCNPAQPATLTPTQSLVCTGTYSLTQADIDAGHVANTAYATSKLPNGTDGPGGQDSKDVPVPQSPHLSLTKVAAEANFNAAGVVLHYTLVATNDGNVSLTDISISDAKLGTLTCDPAQPADLAPAAILTCTGTYTTTQDDLNVGKVTNTANAAGMFGQTPINAEPASATVPAIQGAHLSLTKVATEASFNTVGTVLHYTLVATNDGNVTLTGVSITDAKLGALTCTPGQPANLAPLATLSCTGTYTTTQADVDAGKVDNTANAAGKFGATDVNTEPASATVPAVQSPHISLIKSVQETSFTKAGDVLHYTLVATNDGNVTLSDVSISDPLLGTLTCTPAAPATLAPTATMSCTGSYTVQQSDVDAGHVANTATTTGTFGGHDYTATASKDVPAAAVPSISLTKTATPHFSDPVKVGDTISYQLVATNTDDVTLNNVTISDALLPNLTCTPAQPATLTPGASLTCTGTYTLLQSDLNAGHVANTAYVTSKLPGGGNGPSGQASQDVPITQAPHIALAKSVTETSFTKAGDVLHYTLVATNDGNVTLSNVSISDPLLPALSCTLNQPATLAPAATLSCTGAYTVQQSDVDAGHVANTATAAGTFGGKDYTATASKDVPAGAVPHIALTKTFETHFSTPVKVGDTIDYTLTATNDDSVTLNNVSISDALLPNLTCTPAQPATLAPTQSLVCTGTYTLTQTDIDAGHVANTAYATSKLPGGGNGPSGQDSKDVPVPQAPSILVAKSVAESSFTKAGDSLHYTLVATNTGNVTLTNVSISDPLLPALTCTPQQPVATFAPAATLSCTGSYTVQQSDVDAGKVDNTATVTGTFKDTTVTDTDSAHVPAAAVPSISLTKAATPHFSDPVKVGDTISYELVAKNTDDVTLNNVTISDALLPNLTCTPAQSATLIPGASLTCTGTYVLTQADIDAGHVANTAYATSKLPGGGDGPSGQDSKDVPITQAPHIILTKSVQEASFTKAGDVLHYTLVATNDGNVTLSNVSITDPLLGTLTCDKAAPVTLAPTETLTCTGSYTVQLSDVNAGKVDNTATATGTFGGKDYTATASKSVPSAAQPHIALTKTATPNFSSPVKAGDTISYSLVATNDDDVTLSNVTISDPKLGALSCDKPAPVTLAPNETLTCTGTYTLTQADLDAGKVDNTATVTSTLPGGGNGPTATASADVPITAAPALTLDKTASPMTYSKAGDVIAYSYLVTNSGNATLFGSITVTDDKATVTCPALDIAGLMPGASITCNASYTITQADLNTGSVTNTAYATSGNTKSNTDSVTVTAITTPTISLTKTANPTTYNLVGQTIAYSYLITNTGNVTISGPFTVTDDKLTVTCPSTPASLNPGDTITCTGSYTITQADLDAGSVTNKATATNGTITSNEATATINATTKAAISLTKTANPTTYKAAGDVITYTLVATNTDSVTLNNVTISDPKLGTLTCTPTQPTTLAPNATLTCTGTYTIQAGDVLANGGGFVTNTATVTSKLPGGGDGPTATASATVTQVFVPTQLGVLLPTQTTCQMYASGNWPAMYDAFTYQVKGNKINSVSPGVIFYYNTIKATASSFTINVVETNSLNWKPMLVQQGQAILYKADCSKASNVKVTFSGGNVTFNVTKATVGATYYIGIKYAPDNLVGQQVAKGDTSIYTWDTVGIPGSAASIPVKPKK